MGKYEDQLQGLYRLRDYGIKEDWLDKAIDSHERHLKCGKYAIHCPFCEADIGNHLKAKEVLGK